MENKREFHPAAELFPLLRGKAFQDLVADIKKNGLFEPILVDAEGRILDGRNRYRACLEAKVEPRFVDWQGEGSPVDLALSRNLRRRHLCESQRAMVGARLAIHLEEEALKRKAIRSQQVANLLPAEFGKSCQRTALQVNVSPRLIIHALKVVKEGSEQLITAVESGELAVSVASLLARLSSEEQAQVVAQGSRAAARKAREMRAGSNNAAPGPPSGWGFQIWKVTGQEVRENFDANTVSVIWVPRERFPAALQALRDRGFQDLATAGSAPTPPETDSPPTLWDRPPACP